MSDSQTLKNSPPIKRGRPKKNPTPNPNPPPASADLDTSPENEVIAVSVESHDPAPESGSWTDKLKRATERVGLFDDAEPERIETRGRKKKGAAQEEFSTLVIALLTLAVSFVNIPEQVKPNQSELTVFSNHLTGILIRHLPISSKFSADSLDIIGLVAVCSGWYARVAPEIKNLNKPSDSNPPGPVQDKKPEPPPVNDPVERLSPAAASYLEEVQRKAIENANG